MRRILVCVSHYLPGSKAGGPIRSIANMVEQLGDEFEFSILTSDRDLGDVLPYGNIERDSWQSVGKARVMYLSPQRQSLFNWHRNLADVEHDLIYLNGYFCRFTIRTIILKRLGLINEPRIALAPRGEFSCGALALKAYKKNPYIFLANALDLYGNIKWHASTAYEAEDIRRVVARQLHSITSTPLRVQVAPDLVAPPTLKISFEDQKRQKKPGELRLVFLSRITRKKNLDFAIRVLQSVNGRVMFDIYGPIEDVAYWNECQRLIRALPDNIEVKYCGNVPADRVQEIFSTYHLLLFPTRGENFGHVISEALSAGCPVLISDQTPWRDLESLSIGWDLPLNSVLQFQTVVSLVVHMNATEFAKYSLASRNYALDFSHRQETDVLQAYRRLFIDV